MVGGPVYISDEPSKIVPEVLTPLAYLDGKLLRTAAPATLLPESFFIHPFREDKVFRVISPLEDGVAAIALFNFTEGGKNLESGFSAKDYAYAGELLADGQPWEAPAEGMLVYDHESKSVTPLTADYQTTVSDFGAKLYHLYPQQNGWGLIGRYDKYLPSAAVKLIEATDQSLKFTLAESGPLMIWSTQGAPTADGIEFKEAGENLYTADLAVEAGEREITVKKVTGEMHEMWIMVKFS